MKLPYYPETDSLYVELNAAPGAQTREVADGLNVDLAGVLGFSTDHSSQSFDLSTLETEELPMRSIRVSSSAPGGSGACRNLREALEPIRATGGWDLAR